MTRAQSTTPTRFRSLIALASAVSALALIAVNTVQGTAAATAAPAPVTVDGVAVSVALPAGMPALSAPDPASPYQVASASRSNPYAEATLTGVAFGSTPLGQAGLGPASAGGAQAYRDKLAAQRAQQGATPTGTVLTATIFGQALNAPVLHDSAKDDSVDWVAEAGGRLWIFQVLGAPQAGAPLAEFGTVSISSNNLSAAAPRPSATPRVATTAATAQTAPSLPALPEPWWWPAGSGQCSATPSWSAPLSAAASYRGMYACGPIPGSCSNATYCQTVPDGIGSGGWSGWQCVELSTRYLRLAYGLGLVFGNGNSLPENYASAYPATLTWVPNGTAGILPQPGDVVELGKSTTYGHTYLVVSTSNGNSANGSETVGILEQNASSSGIREVSVWNWTMTDPWVNMVVAGWTHAGGDGPPQAPGSVNATPENGSAWLTWSPPAYNGGQGVTAYTVTATDGVHTPVTVATTGATATAVSGLTNGTSYTFTVTATNPAGTGPASAPVSAAPVAGGGAGRVTAVAPWRILDTRSSQSTLNQGHEAPLGTGQSMNVQVTDGTHVPASATAVMLNVTATDTTSPTYLTVYPTGQPAPTTSNLNLGAHQTVAVAVEAGLGSNGMVTVLNAAGETDVVIDVAGYVAPGTATAGAAGLFEPTNPYRLCDTRTSAATNTCNVTGPGTLGAGTVRRVQVTSTVPGQSTGMAAVEVNLTVTNTSAASYLTVFPDPGTATPAPPLGSNLNWNAGQTVANRALVRVPSDGIIDIYNANGSADVVIDMNGWFTDGSQSSVTGLAFYSLAPARILDTRVDNGAPGPLTGMTPLPLTAVARGGIPSTAKAIVLSVTATDATTGTYLTVYPGDVTTAPVISDLNFGPQQTVANLVVVKLGVGGGINLVNALGGTDVIADVIGYYA